MIVQCDWNGELERRCLNNFFRGNCRRYRSMLRVIFKIDLNDVVVITVLVFRFALQMKTKILF